MSKKVIEPVVIKQKNTNSKSIQIESDDKTVTLKASMPYYLHCITIDKSKATTVAKAICPEYQKVIDQNAKLVEALEKVKDMQENRQKLFNHMSTEHGLTLLESEMNSIYSICIGHEEYVKYLNWLHSKPVDTKTVDAVDALIVLTFDKHGHISGVNAPDKVVIMKTLEQFAESGYNGNFDNDSYYTLESVYIESKKEKK